MFWKRHREEHEESRGEMEEVQRRLRAVEVALRLKGAS
jgi:hypothetical protein